MRLVYVDEAGLSNKAEEPFLVVAAVLIDGDKQLRGIENHLGKLIERHIPERHWPNFVFHATHIFNGGGPVFIRPKGEVSDPEWPLERRLQIAADLAAIPKRFNLPVAVGHVERTEFAARFGLSRDIDQHKETLFAHATAFLTCALFVDVWMRRETKDEICLMVVEDNENARELLRQVHRDNQDREKPRVMDARAAKLLPMRRIKQDPLFEPKKKFSPLQIADFCAYVCKRVFTYGYRHDGDHADPRYAPFFDGFRKQLYEFDEAQLSRRPARTPPSSPKPQSDEPPR